MCLKIYGLDRTHILSALGFIWQAVLKRTKVKLELLTDTDMLLIAQRGNQRWNVTCYSLICKSYQEIHEKL